MKKEKIEFTPEENDLLLALDGYDIVHDALALSETIDLLPDDPTELLDRIEREIPKDPVEKIKKMQELAKTDPEFLQQYVAYNILLKEEMPFYKEQKVEKVSSSDINQQIEDDLYNEVLEKIKGIQKS
jgi:hypothetical protein